MIHIIIRKTSSRLRPTIRHLTTKIKSQEDSSEIFGTLSERGKHALSVKKVERYYPDDKDGYDVEEYDIIPRKNRYYYDQEISKHARQGKLGLKRALELFGEMKSESKLTPELGDFSILIYGCAKAGYTKKAFDLYKESLKYVKKPSQAIVTCLINSCAESPFREYGIKKLNWFREHLKFEYSYTLNEIQYRSAIKAYGKLGQLEEANKVFKEMIENSILPDVNTFNMLLIGCASDRKSGATIALRIYKTMRLYSIKPDLITYRLMLRCIRDCGFGSKELLMKTIGELPAMTNYVQKLAYKKHANRYLPANFNTTGFEWLPPIGDLSDSLTTAIDKSTPNKPKQQSDSKEIQLNSNQSDTLVRYSADSSELAIRGDNGSVRLPNLLSDDHLQEMNRIQAIETSLLNYPSNRLLMFGGLHGYLAMMKRENCMPDEKTFGLLLNCIEHDARTELEYFRLSKDYNIKRDLLFYDLLIRHVGKNLKNPNRLETALSYIDEMHKDNIRPNISTFEELALCCDTWKLAKNLILDVERGGLTTSYRMMERFFETAIRKKDISYLHNLIRYSMQVKYQPTKALVDALETFRLSERSLVLSFEKGRNLEKLPERIDKFYGKSYDKFSVQLGIWLRTVDLYEEEHPWAQFYHEQRAKSSGFRDFVDNFKKLQKLKKEKIGSGAETYGNMAAEVGISGDTEKRKENSRK